MIGNPVETATETIATEGIDKAEAGTAAQSPVMVLQVPERERGENMGMTECVIKTWDDTQEAADGTAVTDYGQKRLHRHTQMRAHILERSEKSGIRANSVAMRGINWIAGATK